MNKRKEKKRKEKKRKEKIDICGSGLELLLYLLGTCHLYYSVPGLAESSERPA